MRLLLSLLFLVAPVAPSPTVEEVAAGWQVSPVYVHPSQQALMPTAEAERLALRVQSHQPAVRIAVVPAAALNEMAGSTREQKARAFVDAVVDTWRQDGVYIVVFGGALVWSSAVGVDTPIGEVLTDELDNYSRSDPVGLLDAVLTRIGVAESPGGNGWLWVLLIALVVLVAAGLGLWRWKRKPDREPPPLYKPSYEVLPDEADTLAERRRLAREDVTRFGEELDAADLAVDRELVAAHAQAAMDAYADAGRLADLEQDDEGLRALRATVEYGRWRLASAQAVLADQPVPPRRAACFFDPAHGMSVTDWMYTPPGGKAREIPVCAACRDRLSGGAQ
ncbi:hypothetical protein OG394_32935 [Kribbella sp. NBC_01245]|uniref:hypothetical protein n=1 Tax=Kribbella sp. NBC_01245 TaxID=2903578 RepID=UPI002E2B96DF|nr:hypothetical protein [Kribbella sp. NBC_01245]